MPDQVDVSVTHEVVINGNKSWVKVGFSTEVHDAIGENADAAIVRASKTVARTVLNEIERQAAVITEATQ